MCFTWPTLEALVSDGVNATPFRTTSAFTTSYGLRERPSMYFIGGTLYETLGHNSIFGCRH